MDEKLYTLQLTTAELSIVGLELQLLAEKHEQAADKAEAESMMGFGNLESAAYWRDQAVKCRGVVDKANAALRRPQEEPQPGGDMAQDFTAEELRLIITLVNHRYQEYIRAASGKETENSRFANALFKKAVVGDDAALGRMAANDRQQRRYSGLRWRLKHLEG